MIRQVGKRKTAKKSNRKKEVKTGFIIVFLTLSVFRKIFLQKRHLTAIFLFTFRSSHKSSHNQHKKVGRSRSHRPRLNDDSVVSTLPEGGLQLPVTFVEKPVLRSTQSFPYEMFFNEASYSSDDSLRT